MIIIYIAIPSICLLLALIFHGYKKETFKNLDNKEHPLRFLYPATARVYDLIKVVLPNNAHSINSLMKQLCVRDNVETEIYLYQIKKSASLVSILTAVCIVGMLLLISSGNTGPIKTLQRSDFGQNSSSYQLQIEYNETTENVELSIDSVSMSEEEIVEYFDSHFDAIVTKLLDKNESIDNVSLPVNLISEFENIEIEWEIEDTKLLNYNGEISGNIEENEFIQVNLYATFSIDDVNRVYCIPLILTGESISSKELLIKNIYEAINDNNSSQDSEVVLPDNINGKKLTFSQVNEKTDVTVFIIGIIAIVAILLTYDKALEKKIEKRRDEMTLDFTEIVFKLSLLYEAGLSIQRSWERIVTEYEASNPKKPRYAYKEMRLTLEQLKTGASEAKAYGDFGKRCGLHQYVKLGNILEQNISKGTKGMKALLRQEAQDSFEERKRLARKKGEEASTKLMVPMIIMLVIVMVIVAVPALMTIGL